MNKKLFLAAAFTCISLFVAKATAQISDDDSVLQIFNGVISSIIANKKKEMEVIPPGALVEKDPTEGSPVPQRNTTFPIVSSPIPAGQIPPNAPLSITIPKIN